MKARATAKRGRTANRKPTPRRTASKKRLFTLEEAEREFFTPRQRDEIHEKAREKVAAIRLQRLREKRAMTQEDLARRMGVSQASLSKLERRENVTLSSMVAYVRGLGLGLHIEAVHANGAREDLIDLPPRRRNRA